MGYTPHHSFRLLDEVRESVRLAQGIGADGKLQPKPMDRAVATMKLFNTLGSSEHVDRLVPVATSAVREASNRDALLERIARESGMTMRVLSAREEAYYGYLGAVNTVNIADGFLIDIGGGSTQVTKVVNRTFAQTFSQPIGALRATDRYIHSDPISPNEFRALDLAIGGFFHDLDWLRSSKRASLTGIGGTIRSLGELDMKLRGYTLDRVHGYILTRDRIEALIAQIRAMTQRQREDLPGVSRDRSDIILAGAMILAQLMKKGRFSEITIGGQGVREGLFYEQFLVGEDPPLFADMRGFSVQNLARQYEDEPLHAAKVRELSLSLFDQLRPLHGYGDEERELLAYAATLHDIGLSVNYYDHHKHGEYLILNSTMQGFTHREIVLMAALVRYHRKGEVSLEAHRDIVALGDLERVARLAALLRLAEYLERRKTQVVRGLTVTIGETVTIVTQISGDATVEIWDANRGSGLFRKAYGRGVQIR